MYFLLNYSCHNVVSVLGVQHSDGIVIEQEVFFDIRDKWLKVMVKLYNNDLTFPY